MNNVLEYIIRAKDQTAKGLKAAGDSFTKLRARVNAGAANMAKSLLSWRSAVVVATAAVAGLGLTLKSAFEFERYETQFKVLFGSLEKAKSHIIDLQQFSASTPFQFGDIAAASRQLIVMTNGVMGAKESLALVGDAAAATGTQISELSTWVGRAYGAIKSGRPFGEAAQRLMEMGIITPDVRAEMEKMQAAGEDNAVVWGKLQTALEKYKGGMEELSKTGEGLFSTLKDNWNLALAEFGKSFMTLAKDDMTALTDKLKQLKEDGSIAVWADKAKTALVTVGESLAAVGKGLVAFYEFSGMSDAVHKLKGVSAAVGTLAGGGGLADAGRAYGKERVKGFYGGKLNELTGDQFGLQAENDAETAAGKAREEDIRAESVKGQEKTAKVEKSLKEEIAKDMAVSQDKINEETAKKTAEKELKEKQKADEILLKDRLNQIKVLNDEEQKLKRSTLAQLATQASDQNTRLAKAEQAAATAWEEYKDPELRKSRLDAEKVDKAARDKFEKDKERVGFKVASGLRLTDQEQAAQRVMAAEAEKEAAQTALLDIAKNTAATTTLLENLMRMK